MSTAVLKDVSEMDTGRIVGFVHLREKVITRGIYRASQGGNVCDPLQDLAVIYIIFADVDLVYSRAQICTPTWVVPCLPLPLIKLFLWS